jgi:hypothetical protein
MNRLKTRIHVSSGRQCLLVRVANNPAPAELSLEELGLRALDRIPRDRALDGIRAFNTMRYAVTRFLLDT